MSREGWGSLLFKPFPKLETNVCPPGLLGSCPLVHGRSRGKRRRPGRSRRRERRGGAGLALCLFSFFFFLSLSGHEKRGEGTVSTQVLLTSEGERRNFCFHRLGSTRADCRGGRRRRTLPSFFLGGMPLYSSAPREGDEDRRRGGEREKRR